MKELDEIMRLYQAACRKYYDVKGLLLFLAIPLLIIIPCLKDSEINGSSMQFRLAPFFCIIFYIVTSLLIVLVWFVKRSIPKIKKDKIGILFGPAHSDEIRKELDDLADRLRREIESKDFTRIISVKKLPPNIEVGQHDKNLEVLSKANAAVLICGNFEKYTTDGKQITGFSSFTVSARKLPISPEHTPILLSDAIAGRQLGWTEENTIHKNVVINNLSEIARYIVGLSLIADIKYERAQAVLGPLLNEIKQKYNQKRLPIEIKRFKKTVQTAFVISLGNKILEEYNKALVEEKIFHLDMITLQKWYNVLNEALRIDKQYYGALLLLAIIQFLSKNIKDAKDSIQKARQFTPTQSQNLCDLSEAFLLCYEGNLREARKVYKKLTHTPPTSQTMNGVFSFLCQAVDAFSDKPQIRFVYALLNDEYGDKSIASKEFKMFISETEGDELYKQWNREAKFRIRRTGQINGNESDFI